MYMIKIIGVGEFGGIYEGIEGKEAIDFLLENESGEIPGALYRKGLGDIDLVFGKNGENGFGLAHIEELHPEVLPYLIEIIQVGEIFKQSEDRILILHEVPVGKGVAVIRLDWNGT